MATVGMQTDGGSHTRLLGRVCGRLPMLRGSMDATEYKRFALGLTLLKSISDVVEERGAAELAESGEDSGANRNEYLAANTFSVSAKARYVRLTTAAQPTLRQTGDRAIAGIERVNRPSDRCHPRTPELRGEVNAPPQRPHRNEKIKSGDVDA